MTSTDTRGLTGQRPTGVRRDPIVSATVSRQQTAPTSFTDPLCVVLDGTMIPLTFTIWPRSQGTNLPDAGDPVVIGYSQPNNVPHVLGWGI